MTSQGSTKPEPGELVQHSCTFNAAKTSLRLVTGTTEEAELIPERKSG